jgi:hypothetical protein
VCTRGNEKVGAIYMAMGKLAGRYQLGVVDVGEGGGQ